jgi:excisionase family DNA binding protein
LLWEKDEKQSKDSARSHEHMVSLVEVAHYLRVHPSTIYRLQKNNGLHGFKLGRLWRFNLDEVDKLRFAEEHLPKMPRTSMPAAAGKFSPEAQTMSSEASLVES